MTEALERLRAPWSWAEASGMPRPDLDRRIAALGKRIDHLERSLEGLQDALYRQSVLEHENISELRRKTEPGRIARDLSEDARKRGL